MPCKNRDSREFRYLKMFLVQIVHGIDDMGTSQTPQGLQKKEI